MLNLTLYDLDQDNEPVSKARHHRILMVALLFYMSHIHGKFVNECTCLEAQMES